MLFAPARYRLARWSLRLFTVAILQKGSSVARQPLPGSELLEKAQAWGQVRDRLELVISDHQVPDRAFVVSFGSYLFIPLASEDSMQPL